MWEKVDEVGSDCGEKNGRASAKYYTDKEGVISRCKCQELFPPGRQVEYL